MYQSASSISSAFADKPFQSFIPVYGSYYSYKQKAEKIQKKIIFLQKVCLDIKNTIQENKSSKKLDELVIQQLVDRHAKICKKIDSLKIKKQVAKQQLKISMGASIASPLAGVAIPGSGMLVSLSASLAQAVVHNIKSEETGEKQKNLVKTATMDCLKQVGIKLAKTTTETLLTSSST